MVKRLIHIVLLLGYFSSGWNQTKTFATISFNKKSVFVKEPLKVTIRVYTSKWFTEGIDLGALKIEGAFSVFFSSNPISKKIKGQTYSGVELVYNVFPYKEKNTQFPALEIIVYTPDDGDYKGRKRIVRTKAKLITVKNIPEDFDPNSWLVAYGMTVSEKWSPKSKTIKVGEIVERQITRKVSGTLPELIPPIVWDSITGIRLYPGQSESRSSKTTNSISGTKTERIIYLFEKEGTFTFPARIMTWWNPAKKKLYKRTLDSMTITVLPNQNLGMLESVRDSLETAKNELKIEDQVKEPFMIFGLPWWQFILIVAIGIILTRRLIKPVNRILQSFIKIRRKILTSEPYQYLLLNVSCLFSKASSSKRLYKWIDTLELDEPSVQRLIELSFQSNFETNRDLIHNSKIALTRSQINCLRKSYMKIRYPKQTDNLSMNP